MSVNIIYICLCTWFVDIIIYILFVWRGQVHKLWYFLLNHTGCFICNKIILNLTHIPPFSIFLFTYLFSIKCLYYSISFFLYLTCSCQYPSNLMLTAAYMFRPFIRAQQVGKREVIQCHMRLWANTANMRRVNN